MVFFTFMKNQRACLKVIFDNLNPMLNIFATYKMKFYVKRFETVEAKRYTMFTQVLCSDKKEH